MDFIVENSKFLLITIVTISVLLTILDVARFFSRNSKPPAKEEESEVNPQDDPPMSEETIDKLERLNELSKSRIITEEERAEQERRLEEDNKQRNEILHESIRAKKGISLDNLKKLEQLGKLLKDKGIRESLFNSQKQQLLK